jgi:hypothetical protein
VTFNKEPNNKLVEVDVINNAILYVDENSVTQEPFEFDLEGDSNVVG